MRKILSRTALYSRARALHRCVHRSNARRKRDRQTFDLCADHFGFARPLLCNADEPSARADCPRPHDMQNPRRIISERHQRTFYRGSRKRSRQSGAGRSRVERNDKRFLRPVQKTRRRRDGNAGKRQRLSRRKNRYRVRKVRKAHGQKTRPLRILSRLFGISRVPQHAFDPACEVPDARLRRRDRRTENEGKRQRILRLYELPEVQFHFAFQTDRSVLSEVRMVPR